MRPFALLVTALLLAGCASPAPEDPDAGAAGAAAGPAWSLAAIDGATYTRDAPTANATVLFFMATWCGTCKSKAPVLADANQTYADRGVRMLSVGFDPTETAADLRAWQERHHHAWPHGLDDGARIQRTFGITSQSSVVVLGADGNVVEKWGYGAVTKDALWAAIERALAA